MVEVQQLLSESYGHYYQLKKQAYLLRESWLRDLAVLIAKIRNEDQESIYNSMLQKERQ